MSSINEANINSLAPVITQTLKERGIEIQQSDIVEALSGAMGYSSSNALKAETGKPYSKMENLLGKLGYPALFKSSSKRKLPDTGSYETTLRFKYLSMMANSAVDHETSIDDFINVTAATLKMLLEWKRLGVVYSGGAEEDHCIFSTNKKEIAESFGFDFDRDATLEPIDIVRATLAGTMSEHPEMNAEGFLRRLKKDDLYDEIGETAGEVLPMDNAIALAEIVVSRVGMNGTLAQCQQELERCSDIPMPIVIEVDYISEWEEGTVETEAMLNLRSGHLYEILQADYGEHYQHLIKEYVRLKEGDTNPQFKVTARESDGEYYIAYEADLAAMNRIVHK